LLGGKPEARALPDKSVIENVRGRCRILPRIEKCHDSRFKGPTSTGFLLIATSAKLEKNGFPGGTGLKSKLTRPNRVIEADVSSRSAAPDLAIGRSKPEVAQFE